MSITPGGWTSFDNPAASPLVNYMSTAGQPVSYGTNSTGGQASQAMQQVLFGQAPTGYTPNFGQQTSGAGSNWFDQQYGAQGGYLNKQYNQFIDQYKNNPYWSNNFTKPAPTPQEWAEQFSRDIPGYVQQGKLEQYMAANYADKPYDGSDYWTHGIDWDTGMGWGQGGEIVQGSELYKPNGDGTYTEATTGRRVIQKPIQQDPNLPFGIFIGGSPRPEWIEAPQGNTQPTPGSGIFGKGGGQPIAQPAPITQPAPAPAPTPAPVKQPKQNSLTQALARTRTAGQGYVRPQARQVPRNTQPRLSTAPIRNRTK